MRKSMPDRPLRRRMVLHRDPSASNPKSHRTTAPPRQPRDPRRHLLRAAQRLRLAFAPTRLPALEDRLPLYFRLWRLDGTWEKLNALIRERLRVRLGRDPQPSAGMIVDSQSVKSTGV